MLQCQNCGQVNAQMSNFCRFCGTNFGQIQNLKSNGNTGSNGNVTGNGYDFSPPRPYSWKTDEFQVSETQGRKSKTINQVQPLNNPFTTMNAPPRPQPLAFQQPQDISYGYQCPRCSSRLFPKVVRKISTAGWIVFAILMITFFPLFWIGLLIKEDTRVCTVCNARVG